jgi:hypothetical protein
MDKTNSVFVFNQNEHEPSASSDEGKARRWVTPRMEPETPKFLFFFKFVIYKYLFVCFFLCCREWESWRMKKSLVESEMLQKLAQHHEKFHDEMKMQLICLQEKTLQSVQNFQQSVNQKVCKSRTKINAFIFFLCCRELDAAYNGELLKLQYENEMLKKELEK